LIVDEASRFVSNDLALAFREARKWLLSLCLATQDVSSLNSNDQSENQALSRAAGLADMKITFRQDAPDDLEHLGKMMAYKRIDRSRRIVEVDRQDGFEKQIMRGRSKGKTEGSGWHAGNSAMEQEAMPTTPGGVIQRREGTAKTGGESGNRAYSEAESESEVLVPKFRVEERDEGMKHPLNDQIMNGIADVSELPKQNAILQYSEHEPISFRVSHVSDANLFFLPGSREQILEEFKTKICRQHSALFRRSEVVIDDEERLRKVVKAARGRPKSEQAIEASVVATVPQYLDATDESDCPFAI
jgi:hypothetical protein